jgi:hypothetical protein
VIALIEPLNENNQEEIESEIPVKSEHEPKQPIEFPRLGVIVISVLLGLIVILSIIMQFL